MTETHTPVSADSSAPSTWTVDTAHSSIHFVGRQMMISNVRGRFSKFDAQIVGDEADPENAQVTVTVDAASLDTGVAQRDEHLRSPDFLNVAEYPTIEFRSTSIRRSGDDRLHVVGDLTIRGVTKPVEFDATLNGTGIGMSGARKAAFTAEATIDRHDWDITWNMPLGADAVLVGRTITLQFELTVEQVVQPTGEVAARTP